MFTIKVVRQRDRFYTKTGIPTLTDFLKLTGQSSELPHLTEVSLALSKKLDYMISSTLLHPKLFHEQKQSLKYESNQVRWCLQMANL